MEKLVTLPEVENKTKFALSPFTWNNLKLPMIAAVPEKGKSISENRDRPSKQKGLGHLKTIKEQFKELKEKNKNQKDWKRDSGHRKEQNSLILQKSTPTQSLQPPQENNRYRQKSKIQKLNQTIGVYRSEQNRLSSQAKQIRFLDIRHNMQDYMRANLKRAGWSQGEGKKDVNLLWSNIQKATDHQHLKDGEFYNHIAGTSHITTKDGLHKVLGRREFYPRSYLLPIEYDLFAKQNNLVAMKKMLRAVAVEVGKFLGKEEPPIPVQLWEILQSSIPKLGSEESKLLVKLCMYLEVSRREMKYIGYFQSGETYKAVTLNPREHFYDSLILKSFAYLDNYRPQYLIIDYQSVDYRLLSLILRFHALYTRFDLSYQQEPLWIIKPAASSRGAGISLSKASRQFCINPQNMWSQFKNKKKYENKIVQRYISNPYILQRPPEFSGRKFDIRQWVLLTSHKGQPVIYKYHTAYCRFSRAAYSLTSLDTQIHLTNYSICKGNNEAETPSVLMLEDLFGSALSDLRVKYAQQANQIILQTIMSCRQITYQQRCFELLGFDFLLDSSEKLHLLEVNLNPSCSADRHAKLKEESENMTKSMIELVTQSKPSSKWAKLHGKNGFQETSPTDESRLCSQDLEVRPYFSYEIADEESLLAYIRYRSQVLSKVVMIASKYMCRLPFSRIKGGSQQQQPDKKAEEIEKVNIQHNQSETDIHKLIHFVQEKSVSNL